MKVSIHQLHCSLRNHIPLTLTPIDGTFTSKDKGTMVHCIYSWSDIKVATLKQIETRRKGLKNYAMSWRFGFLRIRGEGSRVGEGGQRWKMDLGLNKSPVMKKIIQLHSLFPGCVRGCFQSWYLADHHDRIGVSDSSSRECLCSAKSH